MTDWDKYGQWANRPIEDVLILAENSESTDAIRLAGEVRRLQKLETKITGKLAKLNEQYEATEKEYLYAFNNDLMARENEASNKLNELADEIAVLEELLFK